jgi:hypothetical protein
MRHRDLSIAVALAASLALALAASCQSSAAHAVDEAPAITTPMSSFDAAIAPIFAQRCSACHSGAKAKGRLHLADRAGIEKGGASGPVFVAGRASESEIVRRMRLPEGDEDHMPPSEKPQPAASEIAAIAAWIDAGAPFDGLVPGLVPVPIAPAAPRQPPADPRALAELATALVHVERIAPDSELLWIDFASVAAATDDAQAQRLLEPVLDHVAELSLARTRIGAPTIALAARMPRLRRLDLRATTIDDAALALLHGDAHVEDLVLAQTRVTDAGLEHLLTMSGLKRVYLWRSSATAGGIATLRRGRPSLFVDADGLGAAAATVEVEAPIVLTSDAPLPDAPAAGDPAAPINTVCPVTGSPVNPKYHVLYAGRVIGFCCPDCPAKFNADPAKFASKLPK